ncbi:LysM domain-containing protein [Paenibacillus qinlingensis]|uniref:LysM domain-containing protein n=1 Tax=Paenibacillus qinlingensis TaxID=1837343 RepID=A0ABU1NW16_9BACL|nr:LysM domain-containing protein [Paenibacillus qinlingensis]MDR6551664.1 hypothetical protein [Paenibacillus qinlingensis]
MSFGTFGPGFGGYGGFGGFGYPQYGFGGPFYNPYFPRRRLLPYFFLSPFAFPFFIRGEDDRDGTYYAQHQCVEGDSMVKLAQKYNVPQPILEAMNPHIQQPDSLTPGNITYIPRLYKMHCHKMYLEHEVPEGASVPMYTAPHMAPSMHQGPQVTPNPYTGQ